MRGPEVEEVINLKMRGRVGEQSGFFQSPLFPGFQPMKAPVMLWDESSFPNNSASINISMTVKVSVYHGEGLMGKGWGLVGLCALGSPLSLSEVSLSLYYRLQGQSEDPDSLLFLFRRLSDQRGKERSLLHGDFYNLPSGPDLFSYVRQWDQNERFIVVLNFGDVSQMARLGGSSLPTGTSLPAKVDLLLSTQPGREEGTSLELEHLNLQPHEGLLLHFPYVA